MVKFSVYLNRHVFVMLGRLDEAKVSRILHHRVLQLILAYSWARLAILAAGKGKGGNVIFFISSIFFTVGGWVVRRCHVFFVTGASS